MSAGEHESGMVTGAGRPTETLRMLVTVKTYPHPSTRYRETVCTAGITDEGRWIRLYPIPFRYLDDDQQYELYNLVEVQARKRPREKDQRKESHVPVGAVRVVGRVGTDRNWAERKRLILPYARASVEELQARYQEDRESLGIIRPAEITGVKVEQTTREWTSEERAILEQQLLFGAQPKPLEKVPYRFSYQFRCEDSRCARHTMQITDWGLSNLFLKIRRREGEVVAVAKTKLKCEEIAGPDKDTYFYLGTTWPYSSFIVIGMFYPKKERPGDQPGLPLG